MSVNNYVSYGDLQPIVQKIGQKFTALKGAYVFKGSIAATNLPALDDANIATMVGWTYNITDGITTTADYTEGAGKVYSAGVNVAIADVGTAGSPVYKYDVISTFVDVAGLNAAIDAVSDMITAVDFAADEAHLAGAIVKYDGKLYRLTDAHTADDPWDAANATEVSVLELIASAEPSSLTTAQNTALSALLD